MDTFDLCILVFFAPFLIMLLCIKSGSHSMQKVALHKQSTIARLTCIAPPLLPSNMLCPENIADTNSVVSVVSPAELRRNSLDSITEIDN